MAKKQKEAADDMAPKKKSKLLLLIAALLFLIILGVGGYMGAAYFMQLPPFDPKGPTPEELAAQQSAEEAVQAEMGKDIYIKFDAPFTFTLTAANSRVHTGQIDVVLVVTGTENEALAKQHLVLLNSTVFAILSSQSYDSLLKPSGRQRLKRVLLDNVRAKMSEVAKAPVVEQVLFTSFIMQ